MLKLVNNLLFKGRYVWFDLESKWGRSDEQVFDLQVEAIALELWWLIQEEVGRWPLLGHWLRHQGDDLTFLVELVSETFGELTALLKVVIGSDPLHVRREVPTHLKEN